MVTAYAHRYNEKLTKQSGNTTTKSSHGFTALATHVVHITRSKSNHRNLAGNHQPQLPRNIDPKQFSDVYDMNVRQNSHGN